MSPVRIINLEMNTVMRAYPIGICFFLLSVLVTACHGIYEEGSPRRYKMEAYFEGNSPETRVSLTQASNSLDLMACWQDDDAIKVYLGNGASFADAGYERLESVSEGGTKAVFYYSVPSDFDMSLGNPHLYCFTLHSYPVISDWELHCNGSIVRSPLSSFRAPVLFEDMLTGSDSYGSFRHYGVYELLHVRNDSDKEIAFSLIGFQADYVWYRSKGAVKIPSMEFVVSSQAARSPVDASPALTIPAHGDDIIVSWYIPNGVSISNAELVSQIDGEYVHTINKLSSQVVPQVGHAYHMYVTWNGTELRYTTASGGDTGSEVDAGGSGYGEDGNGNVSGTGFGYGSDSDGNITGGGSGYGSDGSGTLSGGGSGYTNGN